MTDRRPPQQENSTNPRCCLAATSGETRGEFKLANIQIDCTTETDSNTHTPELKQRDDVEPRASPLKGTSLQNPELLRNSSEKVKLGANQYCVSINPRAVKMKHHKRITMSQLTCNGADNIPLSKYELHCLGKA